MCQGIAFNTFICTHHMATATPNTLNEFDIVLSLTEAALNAQFLHLFLTEIDDEESSEDDTSQQTITKYLIDHTFTLKASAKSKAGIFGHIECPRVDMNLGDGNDKKRTVRIVIKFLHNKPGTTGDKDAGIPAYDPIFDSVFKYWDSDDDDRQLISKAINGWSFAIEANLGKADIQDIEARYLHPDTYAKLKKGVDEHLFQPSSLFCLFESGHISRSFALYDEQGKRVYDNAENNMLVDQFLGRVLSRFSHPPPPPANNAQGSDIAILGRGLPTPQNPFVLGYGISQPDPKPLPSEPHFNPQNFQFSVTHAPNGFGTLNFLMLLNPIQDINNVEKNLNAGLFSTPFLNRIGAATPHPKLGIPQYDSVMVFSAGVFKSEYMAKCLQPVFKIPLPSFPDRSVEIKEDKVSYPAVNAYEHVIHWESGYITGVTGLGRDHYWGENAVNVKVKSTYNEETMPVSAQRQITIDLKCTLTVHYREETISSWKNKLLLQFSDSSFTSDLVVPFQTRFIVSTGPQGKWTFTRDYDPKYTSFPPMEDDPDHPGKKRLQINAEPNSGKPGLMATQSHTGAMAFQGINTYGVHKIFCKYIGGVAENILASFEEQLKGSLESLATKIVMPAGNVFTFTGLSMDKDHHVYSLMKYQTQFGGEQHGVVNS